MIELTHKTGKHVLSSADLHVFGSCEETNLYVVHSNVENIVVDIDMPLG